MGKAPAHAHCWLLVHVCMMGRPRRASERELPAEVAGVMLGEHTSCNTQRFTYTNSIALTCKHTPTTVRSRPWRNLQPMPSRCDRAIAG